MGDSRLATGLVALEGELKELTTAKWETGMVYLALSVADLIGTGLCWAEKGLVNHNS